MADAIPAHLKRLMDEQSAAVQRRGRLVEARAAVLEVAKVDGREELTEVEEGEFRAHTDEIKALDEKVLALNERIDELRKEEERGRAILAESRKIQQYKAQASVTERRTYEAGNGNSYIRDLAKMQMFGDDEARARLHRHAEEVRTEPEYRDLSRADGSGGFFVPPAWLMGQWIDLARAGRPTANLINTQPLPPGTDSINIPRMVTGTRADVQPADNDPVVEQDLTDGSIAAPVRTIAGQQDIAIQLLDQSPVNFDEIVFRDLLADYARRVDLQVLSGTGTAGQVTGIRNTTGTTSVTLTGTTVPALYGAIANVTSQIHSSRFESPNVIVMHPRRWAALVASTDSAGRPLVVPAAQGPGNAAGLLTQVGVQQVVGSMQGLPIVTDPNIPTNLGTGTNEDLVLVMRTDDLLLYESGIRTRVMPETLSGTLTVRLQVYGYIAFSAARYAQSVGVISGAGLVTPTFG